MLNSVTVGSVRLVARRRPPSGFHLSSVPRESSHSTLESSEKSKNLESSPSPNADLGTARWRDSESFPTIASPDTPQARKKASVEEIKSRLNTLISEGSAAIRRHADAFSATAAATFSVAGAHLNRVTGYEDIEALKREVVTREEHVHQIRQAARDAKRGYEQAVQQRLLSQREVNDLLARRSTWTPGDMDHFTEVVKRDHLHEQAEVQAKAAADQADMASDREFGLMMRAILARYHEEQVWSDKIRSASTYGQLAILGINLVVFLLAIVLVEPWKRRRMARAFEEKVEALNAETRVLVVNSIEELEKRFDRQEETTRRSMLEMLGASKISVDHDPENNVLSTPIERVNEAEDEIVARSGRKEQFIVAGTALSAGLFAWVLRGWAGS